MESLDKKLNIQIYILFAAERQKKRSKFLVSGPGARKIGYRVVNHLDTV